MSFVIFCGHLLDQRYTVSSEIATLSAISYDITVYYNV